LWCFQSASTLRFTQFNKNIELRSSERTGYALHPPYGLVFHESTLTTREGRTRTTIRRNGETFEVEIVRGRAREAKQQEFKHTLKDALAPELQVLSNAGEGASIRVRHFLSDLQTEEEAVVKVVKIATDPEGKRIFEISTKSESFERLSRHRPDGVCVAATIVPGFHLRLQSEAEARKIGSGADLWKLSRTPPTNRPLGVAARRVRRLAIDLTGIPAKDIPVSGRQTVEGTAKGAVQVTLLQEKAPSPCTEVQGVLEAYLASNARIPSRHEKIQAAAKGIVGGESDLYQRAVRIVHWVHRHIRRKGRAHLVSALDVLEKRLGDCTEHAMLCTALCRAVGVPARIVTGLVYCGDSTRAFGLHAWVEVWSGRWVAVDPTWGESLVDGTHLKLGEGMSSYSLLRYTEEIKIRIREVEADGK
jgi:hypothetical protein